MGIFSFLANCVKILSCGPTSLFIIIPEKLYFLKKRFQQETNKKTQNCYNRENNSNKNKKTDKMDPARPQNNPKTTKN